jgi:hypothetical protein
MDGMVTLAIDRKKRIETLYVEEARRASLIFPDGDLISHENPDFLLPTDTETYGIEITELCRERPRTEAATLSRIPNKAKALYNGMDDAEPIDISLAFSRQATDLDSKQLTQSLVEFVYARRESRGICASEDLPTGYCHIGIHEPLPQIDTTGRWHGVRAFDVEIASKHHIECRIASKSPRLATYRKAATVVWLLIVNDQFLGPGEVYVRPDDLAEWKFKFEFEKVLLFAREPGGSGKVFDLQRM